MLPSLGLEPQTAEQWVWRGTELSHCVLQQKKDSLQWKDVL